MRKIDALLLEYSESHQNKINKAFHWICVPTIFFTIVGLFYCIPFFVERTIWANWAMIALILSFVYYLSLSTIMAISFAIFTFLCIYINNALYIYFGSIIDLFYCLIVVFIIAWIGQFIGHSIEGKKPSFFKDIQFLLIGPAWLLHFIYKKLNIRY